MSTVNFRLPPDPDEFKRYGQVDKPVTGWKKWAATLGGLVIIGLVIAVPVAVVWIVVWGLGEVLH